MKPWPFVFLLFLLSPFYIFSQEYNYSHYDSRDGLGSTTVYCMTQDKDGFMWFGTEAGLSRYDGTNFKNFTQEDGLPDNEIIQVFADSRGRIWLSPFLKTVCYYYRGVIHTSENDSLLKNIRIGDNVIRYAEDNEGNILMQERSKLHLAQRNGRVTTFFNLNDKPFGYISLIAGRREGGFWVLVDNTIYILRDGQFTLWKVLEFNLPHYSYVAFRDEMLLWRNKMDNISLLSMTSDKVQQVNYYYGKTNGSLTILDKRYVGVSLLFGALVYDTKNFDSVAHYLPDVPVANMLKDSEGSLWFCTLGKGVYRLNSAEVLNIRNPVNKPEDFLPEKKRSKDWEFSKQSWEVYQRFASSKSTAGGKPFTWYNATPRLNMISWGDSIIITGTSGSLFKVTPSFERVAHIKKEIFFISVKAMCRQQNTLLVATDRNVVVFDPATFKMVDTIWHERATSVFSNNDTVYIGTLTGLYMITPGKKVHYLGEKIKALRSRIAWITADTNHIVWVATTGLGVVGWRNGEQVQHITRQSGLISNFCRTLFYDNGNLWVGTDKGLCRVSVLRPNYPVDKYTMSDGLLSDIVNSVYTTDKKVFVGTPEGITFFEEDKIASQSQCPLRMVNIAIAGNNYYPADAPALIPHEKNSIEFRYVGISFRSNGDIRYRYRLLGLDTNWKETKETFLSYPTLPSGEYQLQLQAINKFDVQSQLLTTSFSIGKLLYERTWFKVLMGLLFLAITGVIVAIIIRRIRKREEEKTATSKRISELEQLSRKAQMNPHFIFNSLNSIQQYVMDADVMGANKFISGFSRLIRQTLDFSSKPEISLEEELDYLTNYLEIEKTRLENAFSWRLSIDAAVDPAEYYIPPMILQPFVENSVRHGLRWRRDTNAVVTITVKREGTHLICVLEDNGVGRKAAMQYKSVSPINYQSKGMSLTTDRIEMFNKEHEHKITMFIDDLEDNFHNSLGTRVTISFPVL